MSRRRLTGWLLVALLCCAWVLGPATAARADDGVVLTRPAYQSELLQALAALRAAGREPDAGTRRSLVDVALTHLPERVQLRDAGEDLALDQRTLRQPLRDLRTHAPAETAYWQTAEGLLVQVGLDAGLTPEQLAAQAVLVTPPAVDEAGAAHRLASDWRGAGQGTPTWLQRVLNKFAQWWEALRNWWKRSTAFIGLPKLGQYAVTGLLAVVLVIAAILALRLFERRRRQRRTAPPGEESAWAEATAGEALARADQLAAAGEYTQALRWLHRAALGRLDEAGLIRFLPAATDWEYLLHLRSAPAGLQEALQDLTDRYQRAFFGGHPADAAQYDQGRTVYLRLQAGTAAGPAPAARAAVTP